MDKPILLIISAAMLGLVVFARGFDHGHPDMCLTVMPRQVTYTNLTTGQQYTVGKEGLPIHLASNTAYRIDHVKGYPIELPCGTLNTPKGVRAEP